jgi:GNAT superfamily N-acetyltransferase
VLEAAKYSVVERLRNGRQVEIRALQPADQPEFLAAVARISDQSLYRRFFGLRRSFSEKEVGFFLNVDFVSHVALVAVVTVGERATIAGGGRYVVVQPGTAEVAFAVVDDFQGQGLGSLLMHHLVALARDAELRELVAEVLPENMAMLSVFQKSGLRLDTRREAGVVHITLHIS